MGRTLAQGNDGVCAVVILKDVNEFPNKFSGLFERMTGL